MLPLELFQSLPGVGEEGGELQSLLLLVVNDGPRGLQVTSVEVKHRHPSCSRSVICSTLGILEGAELLLSENIG